MMPKKIELPEFNDDHVNCYGMGYNSCHSAFIEYLGSDELKLKIAKELYDPWDKGCLKSLDACLKITATIIKAILEEK